jgi:hypothetical protein
MSSFSVRPAAPEPHAERWLVREEEREVAMLDIPPHAERERQFEVSCTLEVKPRAGQAEAWHALRVLVDGALQWQRQVPTHPEGADSLDVRFVKRVPVGQPLRLLAIGEVQGAIRQHITLQAEEEL